MAHTASSGRASEALSRLESALEECAPGDTLGSATPAPTRPAISGSAGRAGSIFSFDSGSPFEPGAAGRRLSLDDATRNLASPPRAVATEPAEAGSIASCRPWSRDDMAARLGTFSARRWFAKPARVSPSACARHGWTNPEYDVLACAACDARLRAPRALDGWSEGATAAFERSLDEGHAELCPWRGNASPPHLLAIVTPAVAGAVRARDAGSPAAVGSATPYVLTAGRSRALAALRARYLALAGPGPEPPEGYTLPLLDGGFLSSDLARAAAHARLVPAAGALASSTEGDAAASPTGAAAGLTLLAAVAEAAQLPDAHALRTAAAEAGAGRPWAGDASGASGRRLAAAMSALGLALVGWTWGVPPAALAPPGAAGSQEAREAAAGSRMARGTLRCAESARTLGAWLFRPATDLADITNQLAGADTAGASGSVQEGGAAAVSASGGAEGGAVAVGSKRPRADEVPKPTRGLHPAREHATDSPWVEMLPAGDGGELVPAWAVAAALLLPTAGEARVPAGLGAPAGGGLLQGALSSVRSLLGSAFAR